jgi:DNA polymerase III epsilon subunit-like protein
MCNLDEQKSKGFTAGDLVKDRPLVFFDLETTGTNISFDRIIEYSFIKISQDGKKDVRLARSTPECIFQRNLQPYTE